MTKRLALSLLVLLLSLGGAYAWTQYRMAELHASLDMQTAEITQHYAALADNVGKEAFKKSLTDEQKQRIAMAKETAAKARINQTVRQRVAHISVLQKHLSALADSFDSAHPAYNSEHIAKLRLEMSERGSIRTLLQAYNDNALAWNAAQGSAFASVLNIDAQTDEVLPFLRFNGQQEFIPTIDL